MEIPCFVNRGTVEIDTKPYGALTHHTLVHNTHCQEVEIDTKPYGALTQIRAYFILKSDSSRNRYKALRGINTTNPINTLTKTAPVEIDTKPYGALTQNFFTSTPSS